MALASDPHIMTEWISGLCRQGFGRFLAHTHTGDDRAEKEGDASSDERDDRRLDLEQGKVAEDEVVPDRRDVEVAHVGCGSETG
jgi:hypothetical protein